MPRQVAPPPSGEFHISLTKPFTGEVKHTIEVVGEPNREASVRLSQYNGGQKSTEKTGQVPKDDVNELMDVISIVRGFPSHPSKDLFGADTKLDFTTFDIQWGNQDEASDTMTEVASEQKDEFKRVADSIEALARTFAKQDSAV